MINKGYDEGFLERLKANSEIVSVIGKYVTLSQKGKTHWGCCPFHMEKTPSFSVNGLEQYYKCFGCGEGGDVIKFIQKIESVDFISAVKILAEAAGMQMPSFMGDEKVKEKKQKKDKIIKANKDAAIFFNKALFTPKGAKALEYLQKRGLNKSTIIKFGLGYSFDWTSLVYHLKKLGYTEEVLKEAGLLAIGKSGKPYDIMAERIVFPIINSYGEVIGFSGRALQEGRFAKYLNTSQTLAFDKSRIVYGINLLKKLKQTSNFDYVIIVEGQMDTIALYNAGFENVVACMGTALTKYHAKELKRFTNKVIISFDGDIAGQKATLKSLEILQEEDIDTYVVSLPNKLDPDEYIKKHSKEGYYKLLDEALPLNDYKLKVLSQGVNLSDSNQLAKFIDASLGDIMQIKTSHERETQLKKLSEQTKIDIYTLKKDLEYKISHGGKKEDSDKDTKQSTPLLKDAITRSEEYILASLVHKKPFAKLPEEDVFNLPIYKRVYEFILNSKNSNKDFKVGDLFTYFDSEEFEQVNELVAYNFEKVQNQEKYFKECMITLELEMLGKKQKELLLKIENPNNLKEKTTLLQELMALQKQITDTKNKK